ncbi:MAG TPA: TIGR03936 family radical SAM-associated protein [Anaerolineaceae bacterium]|nr:TIGR03936 family radical SAM-associated protein [Anaerolineaceae bacterium]
MSESDQPTSLSRLRIQFGKTGSMRYVGNLDMHTVWERTFRRAGLPLFYTKGFSPHPRFQMAASLPVGAASQCELIDVWLVCEPETEKVLPALVSAAPPGLEIVALELVDPNSPALQNRLNTSDYIVTFRDPPPAGELSERLAQLMATASLPRERRGKSYDLRPLIEEACVLSPENGTAERLFLRLSAREGATGRPEEVLAALGYDPLSGALERVALHFR